MRICKASSKTTRLGELTIKAVLVIVAGAIFVRVYGAVNDALRDLRGALRGDDLGADPWGQYARSREHPHAESAAFVILLQPEGGVPERGAMVHSPVSAQRVNSPKQGGSGAKLGLVPLTHAASGRRPEISVLI